jgi:hypothetical protein
MEPLRTLLLGKDKDMHILQFLRVALVCNAARKQQCPRHQSKAAMFNSYVTYDIDTTI